MSDILKFACKAPKCGRRFTTQEGLNTHFKLRHPELVNNNEVKPKIENDKEKEKIKEKPSMDNIIKQISKTKLNHYEKHHILQPIDHKGLSSSLLNNIKRKSQTIKVNKDLQIYNSNNSELNISNTKDKNFIKENNKVNENKNKEIKKVDNNKINKNKINEIKKNEEIEEVEIPNIIEEKQKKLLNNLFGQINSLEKYLEKDCEFHKQFTLPDVPDYDKMYDSDEEDNENKEITKIKNKEKNEKKEEKNIYEITCDMIFRNKIDDANNDIIYNDNDNDNEKYKEIHEINLSKKNIINFKNKKNIDFEKLTDLYILNLSYNKIIELKDIHYFENLKELYINNNKIEDISFCESLPNLLILNAENNNIINITSLNICSKLKILKLFNNKIKYLNSTLRTIKNLKNIEELSIKENPFLSELFSYREYFISNYTNIKIFDGEKIDKEKKIFAENFYNENNPLYHTATNRPMTSTSRPGRERNKKKVNEQKYNDLFGEEEEMEEENEEDIFNINNNNNEIFAKTQAVFGENQNDNNAVKKVENININNDNSYTDNIKDDKINNENNEKKKLKDIIEAQNKVINELRIELDKSTKLNKEYENQIEKYKIELEEDDINNEGLTDNNNINDDNEENNKILKELELWKKEYFDLLEKTMNNKNINRFSEDLFDTKNDNKKKDNIDKNKNEIIIERPQTATLHSGLSKSFEKLYEEIDILKSKNNFADVLNEETDEDENEEENNDEEDEKEEKLEEEGNKNMNVNKVKELEVNEQIKEDEIDDEIPDEEIENMFRKSYQNIEKMKQDLQAMNETLDKKSKNDKNNYNNNKININNNLLNNNKKVGNKQTLKPIIIKKENNHNIIANKTFGKQGNLLTGFNKNINENNKNPSQRYHHDILFQIKK